MASHSDIREEWWRDQIRTLNWCHNLVSSSDVIKNDIRYWHQLMPSNYDMKYWHEIMTSNYDIKEWHRGHQIFQENDKKEWYQSWHQIMTTKIMTSVLGIKNDIKSPKTKKSHQIITSNSGMTKDKESHQLNIIIWWKQLWHQTKTSDG